MKFSTFEPPSQSLNIEKLSTYRNLIDSYTQDLGRELRAHLGSKISMRIVRLEMSRVTRPIKWIAILTVANFSCISRQFSKNSK